MSDKMQHLLDNLVGDLVAELATENLALTQIGRALGRADLRGGDAQVARGGAE